MVADVINRITRRGPARIDPYRAFGPPAALRFAGRVLANPEASTTQLGEHSARTVLRMAERFATREIADEPVLVELGNERCTTTTNSDGYFEVTMAIDDLALRSGSWIHAQGSLPDRDDTVTWTLPSLVLDESTDRLVISDIDDTILSNGAGNVARTVLQTISGSHLTRLPISGAPELYQAITTLGATANKPCPVFYVSSSPWNLYDFLTAFMDHHGFPVGPLLLRDLGLNRSAFGATHGAHKVNGIATILIAAPNADVVLIGDTSQQDAAAFSATIIDHIDRVTAAYLRDVGDQAKADEVHQFILDEALDDTMMVVSDLADIAADLRKRRWGATNMAGQNIYDDPDFFAGYVTLDRQVRGLDGAPEWPALRAMLPELTDRRVIDLGCGFGWFSRWAESSGARRVVGIDLSTTMLDRARTESTTSAVVYQCRDLDQVEFEAGCADLVFSSLTLHYVLDLERLLTTVAKALRPGGTIVFSVEHPIYSAPTTQAFESSENGDRIWPLRNYLVEGPRHTSWFIDGVRKEHRTIATYLNTLIGAGFVIDHVVEWGPTAADVEANQALAEDRHRPWFLLLKATLPADAH